jgi:hypothetical protein
MSKIGQDNITWGLGAVALISTVSAGYLYYKSKKSIAVPLKEQRVLEYIFSHAKENDVNSIISAYDEFVVSSISTNWMMNVGPQKGRVLDDAIVSVKPQVLLNFCVIINILVPNPVDFPGTWGLLWLLNTQNSKIAPSRGQVILH